MCNDDTDFQKRHTKNRKTQLHKSVAIMYSIYTPRGKLCMFSFALNLGSFIGKVQINDIFQLVYP